MPSDSPPPAADAAPPIGRLELVEYPHPALARPARALAQIDDELCDAVEQMFEIMYAANGIGLAATQVALPYRLFVVNVEGRRDAGEELVFVNPVLSRPRGIAVQEEGCLSLPGLRMDVRRPERVCVEAWSLDGAPFRMDLDGLVARVVQHEYDHLDGTVFVDRMTATVRVKAQPALDEFDLSLRALRQTGAVSSDDVIAGRLAQWEQRYA